MQVDNDSINFKFVSMFIVHGTLVWEWEKNSIKKYLYNGVR